MDDDDLPTIADWNGYYKDRFGVEEPLFMGISIPHFKKYFGIVDTMAGKKEVFKNFILESNMTNCVLLPFKAPDGSYKINVMHCVFPEHYDSTEWAPRATEVIGTDDVEFCSSWKRFDPWMAWARLSYLKDVIHHYVLCRIPIFGEFLAVNSEEEFVTLIGKHPDCTYGFLMIEKFPNGFVLIPYLLKLFNIHSGVDPHKLWYKIVLWINAELKKRKDSSINNDTGVGFKYLYKQIGRAHV